MCAIAWPFSLSLVASVVMLPSHLPRLACTGLAPSSPCPRLVGAIVISALLPMLYAYLLAIATYVCALHWMHPFSTFSANADANILTLYALSLTTLTPILMPSLYDPHLALWSTKTLAPLSRVRCLNDTFLHHLVNVDSIISIHVDCCVQILFLKTLGVVFSAL
jgi:hypothetical protein